MSKLAEIYARRERTLKRRERRREREASHMATLIARTAVGEHTRQMEELRRMRDNPNPYQTGIGAALASKIFG